MNLQMSLANNKLKIYKLLRGIKWFIFSLLLAYVFQPLLYIFISQAIVTFDSYTAFKLSKISDYISWNSYVLQALAASLALLITAYLCVYLTYQTTTKQIKIDVKQTLSDLVKKHFEIVLFAFVLIWACISLLFSPNKLISIKGYPSDPHGLVFYLMYIPIFTSIFFLSNSQRRAILDSIIVLSLAFFLYELILDVLNKDARLVYNYPVCYTYKWCAIFRNRNFYGYFLSFAIITPAALFFISKKRVLQVYYLIAMVLNLFILLLNKCDGAFLGVIGGLIFILCSFSMAKKKFEKKALIPIAVFLVFYAIFEISGLTSYSESFIKIFKDLFKLSNANEYTDTEIDHLGSNRIKLWKDAFYVMKVSPLFGNGIDCYLSYSKIIPGTLQIPHNEYLQVGQNMGIPAMLAYVAALIYIFVKSIINRKNLTQMQLVALSAGFAYFISAFFGNSWAYMVPYVLFLVAMSLGYHVSDIEYMNEEEKKEYYIKLLEDSTKDGTFNISNTPLSANAVSQVVESDNVAPVDSTDPINDIHNS